MQNECGRTLTETLVMLAIVGILSIVGIRGYTSAMDKSKANTLIQEAQKRAVVVAGQIGFNNQTPSLAEFEPYNTTSAGTFGDVITKGLTNQFGIQVSNVNKSICQNILNTIGDKTPIRRLSYETTPTTPITTCKEDDDFLFVYNKDMTGDDKVEQPRSCRTVNDCKTSCATCEIEEGEETGTCREECEEPIKLCTVDADCNQTNECMVCDTDVGMCKDGCERVDWLESNGTQYIDTNYPYISTTDEIELYYMITELGSGYSWGFGSLENGVAYGISCYNTTNGCRFSYVSTTSNFDLSTQMDTQHHLIMNKNGIYNDGSQVKNGTGITLNGSWNNHLFALSYNAQGGSSYYAKERIWGYKQTRNGKTICDFVPVIAPNGKACMFNKVPDEEDGKLKLYCDANGGNFKTNKD